MGQTDKGVLIFYEWFEAMDSLNPKCYKEMMRAIWRYQKNGEEPPEFTGKSAIVAAVVFPFLHRRINSAKAGKMSIIKQYDNCDLDPRIANILKKKAIERWGLVDDDV